MATQLAFELLEPAAQPPRASTKGRFGTGTISWSYSRRNLLEQCPRRYYYQYYGSIRKAAPDQHDKPLLRFLKTLPNRHERVGTILHFVIAKALRGSAQGATVDSRNLRSWARRVFEQDVEYSLRDPRGMDPPIGKYPPVLLREFYYESSSAESDCQIALERLTSAIEFFAESSTYADFRDLTAYTEVLIEQSVSVPGLPFKVRGRVDLALSRLSEAVVLDWKLAASSSGDDSLQLVSYALWACDHFGIGPDSVEVLKASLTSDTLERTRLTQTVLRRGRARMMQDVESMVAMESYGIEGEADAFSACAQPRVCGLCPFLEVCQEGRAAVDRD